MLKRLEGNLSRPAFARYLQVRDRRARDAISASRSSTIRVGSRSIRRLQKLRRNADAGLILNHMRGLPESVGQTAADAGCRRSRSPGSRCDGQPRPARRSGQSADRDRSRARIRQTQGTERGDSGALGELAAAEYPILGRAVTEVVPAQKAEDETIYATAAAVTAAIERRSHRARARREGDAGGGSRRGQMAVERGASRNRRAAPGAARTPRPVWR